MAGRRMCWADLSVPFVHIHIFVPEKMLCLSPHIYVQKTFFFCCSSIVVYTHKWSTEKKIENPLRVFFLTDRRETHIYLLLLLLFYFCCNVLHMFLILGNKFSIQTHMHAHAHYYIYVCQSGEIILWYIHVRGH